MTTQQQLNQHLQKILSHGAVKLNYPAGCPDIGLYLFDPDVLQGPLSHDEAQAVVATPAYWSFCWASGQVLAQYLLNNPVLVKDKVVVDVGTGSGIVAIAAVMAGASRVFACDIDSDALDAAQANACVNQVTLESIASLNDVDQSIDLITAADVLYDQDNFELLSRFTDLASKVLLADSRIKALPVTNYHLRTTIEARTWPDLNEFEEFNQVRIYCAEHA